MSTLKGLFDKLKTQKAADKKAAVDKKKKTKKKGNPGLAEKTRDAVLKSQDQRQSIFNKLKRN